MSDQRLSGKRALVTGAAQNIGRAIAERFAAAGATVVLADRQEDPIRELADRFSDVGGRALAIPVDLTQRHEAEAMVDRAIEAFGGLDVLVNNAYTGPYKRLTDQDDEGWDRAMAVGVHAIMGTCRRAIPHMIEAGHGSIINVGSMNSFNPAASMAVYSAVKGAVVNFSRQLAVDYGPSGVRCNALCPGFITHAKRNQVFREKPLEKERVLATIPLRRLGECEDIAHAALFLASDESSFMTGQCLVIDGGAIMQNPRMVTHPFEASLRAHLTDESGSQAATDAT